MFGLEVKMHLMSEYLGAVADFRLFIPSSYKSRSWDTMSWVKALILCYSLRRLGLHSQLMVIAWPRPTHCAHLGSQLIGASCCCFCCCCLFSLLCKFKCNGNQAFLLSVTAYESHYNCWSSGLQLMPRSS